MELRRGHGGGESLGPWRKRKMVLAGQTWTWEMEVVKGKLLYFHFLPHRRNF